MSQSNGELVVLGPANNVKIHLRLAHDSDPWHWQQTDQHKSALATEKMQNIGSALNRRGLLALVTHLPQ